MPENLRFAAFAIPVLIRPLMPWSPVAINDGHATGFGGVTHFAGADAVRCVAGPRGYAPPESSGSARMRRHRPCPLRPCAASVILLPTEPQQPHCRPRAVSPSLENGRCCRHGP
jgi:hypothetical protein